MILRRHRRPGVAAVPLLSALLFAARAHAAVLLYPGTAPPCDETLQGCIDGAQPGDVIQITTELPIGESLEIPRSLTLTSANGVVATIGAGPAASIIVGGEPEGDALSVTLSHLNFNNAQLSILLNDVSSDGTPHRVEVSDCALTHAVPANASAGIDVELRAPASIVVRHNRITTTGRPVSVFSRHSGSGEVAVTILGNVITASDPGFSSSGIALDLQSPNASSGPVAVDILSNVIHNVAGCNCNNDRGIPASGIIVDAGAATRATVDIINNTLHQAKAIVVRSPPLTARLTVHIFNNIVSAAEADPIDFPNLVDQLQIQYGFNDLVKPVGQITRCRGYCDPDAVTLNINPQYIGPANGNFRLRDQSPVIGQGLNGPPGGLPSVDADGNMRVAGGVVDLGAYEWGSSPPTASTTTTTSVTFLTTSTSSTTSTSIFPERCDNPVPTFDSVECRLRMTSRMVEREIEPGTPQDRLLTALTKAQTSMEEARELVRIGEAQRSKAAIRRAIKALRAFSARLRSRQVRRAIEKGLHTTLTALARELRADLSALRRG